MKHLDRLDRLVCCGGLVLGGLALVALMAIMGAHVMLRLVGRPMTGAHELCGLLGAFAIACALADAQRQKVHVTVDILSAKFPAVVQRALAGLNALLFAVFYGVLGAMVARHGLVIRARGELSETLKLAFYPFVLVLAAGMFLLALTLLLEAVGEVALRRAAAVPVAAPVGVEVAAEVGELA